MTNTFPDPGEGQPPASIAVTHDSVATLEPLAPVAGITGYPLQVTYDVPQKSARFWAVPVVGLLAKWVILIPHLLILSALGGVVGLLQMVIWVPVLFGGTYPEWAYGLTSGYLRWTERVWAYSLGLTDAYPPFELGTAGVSSAQYPVRVEFERPSHPGRFWAIPILGLLAKWIILIPHFLILSVLGLVVGILQLVLWVPVLVTGRFPGWGYGLISGYLQWHMRVLAYQLGLNDRYPPFQL